jgi:transposase, IS5 family
VTATIRREMKRRAAIEPVIGHLKAEHRMDRNYLKGFEGDRANAVLAAAGYNFRLLLRWLAAFLCALIELALFFPPTADRTLSASQNAEPASWWVLHERQDSSRPL